MWNLSTNEMAPANSGGDFLPAKRLNGNLQLCLDSRWIKRFITTAAVLLDDRDGIIALNC